MLAVVAVALVVIAITSLGTNSSSSSAATKRTATVGKGVVQSTVSGNGTLEPAEKVELSFGASGEVTAIQVKAGEKVTKGEVLAEVDSSSARASLASAEAKLLEAEETLEGAEEAEESENEEAAYEGGARTSFVGLMSKEGTAADPERESSVEGTAPEGGSTPTKEAPVEAHESEKEATKPEATKPEATEPEATKPGKQEEAAPTTTEAPAPEAEPQAAAPSEATAAPSSGSSEVGGMETGAAGAIVSVPTAEANLREAELTVDSARQEVRETTMRAPISGTITSISGSVGESVSGGSQGSTGGGSSETAAGGLGAIGGGSGESSSSGSAFMTLAQVDRLKMEVSFSESDIGKVRKGQTATVSIDALEGTELAGRVTDVSVLASEGSSSVVEYPATILVTQSAKGVRAGMSASAEVVTEQVKDAISVPSEAISSVGNGKTVTVEEDGKEQTKTVKTGLVGDETTEVISGLTAGETLILPETTVATGSIGGEGGEGGAGGFPGGGGGFPGGGAGGFTPPSGGGFPGAP